MIVVHGTGDVMALEFSQCIHTDLIVPRTLSTIAFVDVWTIHIFVLFSGSSGSAGLEIFRTLEQCDSYRSWHGTEPPSIIRDTRLSRFTHWYREISAHSGQKSQFSGFAIEVYAKKSEARKKCLPWQVLPSAWMVYPGGQRHLYEPGVLIHPPMHKSVPEIKYQFSPLLLFIPPSSRLNSLTTASPRTALINILTTKSIGGKGETTLTDALVTGEYRVFTS